LWQIVYYDGVFILVDKKNLLLQFFKGFPFCALFCRPNPDSLYIQGVDKKSTNI
jgi:hypothetical protein